MVFKKKILSIDGGGIKGIIPAVILDYIEKQTEKPIYQLFDLIAGTSTGGILALGLTKPKKQADNTHIQSAEYSAENLVKLYQESGEIIFPKSTFQGMSQWFNPKYNQKGRIEVIAKYLGNSSNEQKQTSVPLKSSLTEIVITSYDTRRMIPVLFTSNPNKEDTTSDNFRKICQGYTMFDAAMATSAAPTFFQPYLASANDKTATYSLIDGGVFANNPTTIGIVEAMNSHYRETQENIKLDDILVVSLGTGSLNRQYTYNEIKKWGQLKWVEPFIYTTFNGQSQATSYLLEELIPKNLLGTKWENKNQYRRYYRFQVSLAEESNTIDTVPGTSDDMDDASFKNISNLERAAKNYIEMNQRDLDAACELLVEVS